jgi:hypothetical protein
MNGKFARISFSMPRNIKEYEKKKNIKKDEAKSSSSKNEPLAI